MTAICGCVPPQSTGATLRTSPRVRCITWTAATSPTSTPSSARSGRRSTAPGGWFGGDLFWLHENAATGDGGATPGFRMIWHNCQVARTHLVSGYDRKSWLPAVTFDDLVSYLTEDGVQLELR